MRRFPLFRLFLLVVSVSWGSSASAAYYSWYSSFFNITAGSPGAVCDQIDGVNDSLSGFVFSSEAQAQCLSNAGNPVSSTNMVRNGTGCQPTYTYNTTTGGCEAPPPDPCFALYGQSKGFTLSGNSNDPGAFYQPIAGSNYWTNPGTVVLGGCAATVETGTKCKVYGDGAYTCVGSATYQGVTADPSAGEAESEECTGEACPDTQPTPTSGGSSECTNWVEDAEGRRTRTCETTSEASQSGQAACLTNGSLVCVSASPTPEKDTKTRTDDVAETPQVDGGKKTDTTSTTTKTYCAAGACTTTTTTNNTSTITNGAGETVSESGTCEGDDCADPESAEEEKGEPGVTASVVGVEYPELLPDEAPEFGATAQVFMEKVQTIPFIQAARTVDIPQGGGSCVVGNVSLWGGSINLDGFCTMLPTVLNPLSYLFLAGWSFMALRILLSA